MTDPMTDPRDESMDELNARVSPGEVLEALVRGGLVGDVGLPAPSNAALEVFDGSIDPLVVDPEDRDAMLSSWLGAGLLARFAPHLSSEEIWSAILGLKYPPLDLPLVLDHLYVHQPATNSGLVARACAHLESLLNGLDAYLSPRLTASLGLPWTLGRIVDSLTLALEVGAPPPASASAVQPLVVVLERLGVTKVWDLLPATRGSLSHRAAEVPLDVLAGMAESLNLLGAAGAATRSLVLLLLLSEPSRVEDAHRRLLTRLVVSREAKVPPGHVVGVWSLANR